MLRPRYASPRPKTAPFTVLYTVLAAALGGPIAGPAPAAAQAPTAQTPTAYAPAALSVADYQRAERFLGDHLTPLVLGGSVSPEWLADGRFWYRTNTERGVEFILVDPAGPTRAPAFDHAALAAGLSAASGTTLEPYDLPITGFTLGGNRLEVELRGRSFSCEASGRTCTAGEARDRAADRSMVASPDGNRVAFIRDHDLWVRDRRTGRATQLTTDGVEDYGYATDNAGWVRSDRPVLLWSPDSRKIATFRHDARGVGEMYLVSTAVGHPELEAWKYPLPEDSVVFRIERIVIDVETARVVKLDMPADVHRSTICDHIYCDGRFSDVEWSPDGSQLAFVSSSRDHKEARLRIANPETGAVREVLEERVETFFESGYNKVNWHILPERGEVLWYSQRDDWGHLYLYDLATGALERQVTSGAWNVLQVLRIDRDGRTLYFTGAGREPGDPYFQYFYKVGLDDGVVTLLTPDSANHRVSLSPEGDYFVDEASTPTTPPVTVLCDLDGTSILALEEADISRLVATGWEPPIPFTVKARDGVADLYGLMWRPLGFDPSKKYPVVNYLYPGPQTGSVGSRSFSPARRDHRALAELGFVVVALDATGTPMRSKSFHAAYYGDMGDNGLPDQVGGIQQLAERYPWMDIDRVGIWGHSGGGFASTAGILRYPDFYKVAVSQAGNHDNRNYEDDWGEKWQGLLKTNPDGTTTYDNQANQLLVDNLKGKLLIAHGTMDSNVPPNNTLAVVDALIAANKDFDLIMMTNRRHGFAMEPYMMRRRWDYFVKNLLGAEPPKEFVFGGGALVP